MRNEKYSSEENIKKYVVQVEQGGTGVATKEEALEILGAVDKDTVGKPNGVLGLNEDGFIDQSHYPADFGGAAGVNIFGPTTVDVGGSILLEITNYDVFTPYSLSAYKVTVEREEEKLLVTGVEFGTDAWFSVNGSVYGLTVVTDNDSLQGDLLVYRDVQEMGASKIMASSDGSTVVLLQPNKDYNGSSGAGSASVFTFATETGYTPLFTTDPGTLNTRITYSGIGTKRFTANNQVYDRADQGYIDIVGAGNIRVEAEGELVLIPATPQEGLPTYPNGLPSFREAIYSYKMTDSGATKGSSLFSDFEGYATMVRNVDGTYEITSTVTGPMVEHSGNFYRTYPDEGPLGKLVYGCKVRITFSLFDDLEEVMEFECSRTVDLYTSVVPREGNPAYPNGLAIYKPAEPSKTVKSTIEVSSDNFKLTGQTLDSVVYPFENFNLGDTADILNQNVAIGCPRSQSSVYPNGGTVIVRKKIGNDWFTYQVTTPKTSTYPLFGKAVKLWGNGDRMMVGAPGINTVMQYNFANNAWNEGTTFTIEGLATAANFGTSIDITSNDSVMAIGAPGALVFGAVYLYQWDGNNYVPTSVLNIQGLQNSAVIGHKVRVVNAYRVFATVRTPSNANNYVAEFTVNELGQWVMAKAFFNPSGSVDDSFGEDFDISQSGGIMFISARGSSTAKGRVHIWMQVDGNWVYYKAFSDPNGGFGDGFGRSLAINSNGKFGHVLKSDLNTASLGYYQ